MSKCSESTKTNVLLIGGDGFLGKGLQAELSARNVNFTSIDKTQYDMTKAPDADDFGLLEPFFNDATHIVMLAAYVGAKLFNSSAAKPAAAANSKMTQVFLQLLTYYSQKFGKSFDVTYYSTSEVYGSMESRDDFITEETTPHGIPHFPRFRYAYNKFETEQLLRLQQLSHPDMILHLKVLRPFNVYGKGQTRGVIYDMICSALKDNMIPFSDDTTRTFTDIELASKAAVDTILSNQNELKNVADPRNSLTLEAVAHIVNNVLGSDCKFTRLEPDPYIRYRQVSNIDTDISMSTEIMRPHILALRDEIVKSLN